MHHFLTAYEKKFWDSDVKSILTRAKLDPVTASVSLIATVMDATGLILYFTIATVILGLL